MSVQKALLCPFHCKRRLQGVNLESPGLENIPQLQLNWSEVTQNTDSHKAVSVTLSVLKWSGAIFRPWSSKVSVEKVSLCSFHCKPRPSGVSLASPGLENIPQIPGNRAQVGQNHDVRKAVPPTLSVVKWSWVVFRPRSTKVCVRKVLLCPFH